MQKFGRIAFAISLSIATMQSQALAESKGNPIDLPALKPESQHAESSKRIKTRFVREHFKKITMDDELSSQIFDRYLKHLDYNRNVFLSADIDALTKYRLEFDTIISRGKLEPAYEIYNLNLQRKVERFEYALTLLEKPFDFTIEEEYSFDRENAPWPKNVAELDALWRQKVKYDALSLTLANKTWPEIQEKLTKRYNYAIKRLKQTKSEDVFQILMNSFARVVEPHTSYLSPKNAERFQMEMNLSLEGIGAVLRSEEDFTVIQSVVVGGPAEKSKQIKPKDKIVGVAQGEKDFVDVVGWRLDDVVDLIKGRKGTEVRLQIQSGESDSDTNLKVVSIIRDKIKLEDRAAKSEVYLEKNTDGVARKLGVINIPSFYNNLSKDVKAEIKKLTAESVEGIIIDLRGNGGGSLTEATLLTGLFIDKGPVVQVLNQRRQVDVQRDIDGYTYYEGPLMVMVDRYSASASEIFSAAMQDYGRAIIVGEYTFGKGTVQQHQRLGRVYDLYNKPFGVTQHTISKFYRINGGSTQHRGVVPDIPYPSAIAPEDWGESKEENALPWDQIPRASYRELDDLSDNIRYLSSLHQERIKQNPEFAYLQEDISLYQQEKDNKTISLNIDKRKAKTAQRKEKQLIRTNERLARLGQEPVKSLDDDLPEALTELDPFLDETANIAFDMISLHKIAKNN